MALLLTGEESRQVVRGWRWRVEVSSPRAQSQQKTNISLLTSVVTQSFSPQLGWTSLKQQNTSNGFETNNVYHKRMISGFYSSNIQLADKRHYNRLYGSLSDIRQHHRWWLVTIYSIHTLGYAMDESWKLGLQINIQFRNITHQHSRWKKVKSSRQNSGLSYELPWSGMFSGRRGTRDTWWR